MVSVMVVACAPESPPWHTRACVRCSCVPAVLRWRLRIRERCACGSHTASAEVSRPSSRGMGATMRCCGARSMPASDLDGEDGPSRGARRKRSCGQPLCAGRWMPSVSMPHRRCPLRPVLRAAWAEHRCAVHVVPPRGLKDQAMLSLVLGSPPAQLIYCRVHQRAWVASLDRWVAFHVPTRDGSPRRDAPCDRCPARHQWRGGSWRALGWSGARAGDDNGDERWSAAAQETHEPALA